MNILDIKTIKINEAIAYFIGLSYPLIKIVDFDGKKWVVGAVNHNSNLITQEDLASHFLSVNDLITKESVDSLIVIQSNKSEKGNISTKEGFCLMVECLNYSKKDCEDTLNDAVSRIVTSSAEIRKKFVMGCFDGRSSWDTTAHYLSIDVDRDIDKQNRIAYIAESLGIGININRREIHHPKNDQIRVKQECVQKYIDTIGFYSICRNKLVQRGLSSNKKGK